MHLVTRYMIMHYNSNNFYKSREFQPTSYSLLAKKESFAIKVAYPLIEFEFFETLRKVEKMEYSGRFQLQQRRYKTSM